MTRESNIVLEGLKKAYDLIGDKKRWTQKAAARDKRGHIVLPGDPTAKCWCARGAVSRSFGSINRIDNIAAKVVANRLLEDAANDCRYGSVVRANDVIGWAGVRRVFRSAMVRAAAAQW